MVKYLYEDQKRIEDALMTLAGTLYDEVGAHASVVKIFGNGDINADISIDKEGSVFHMEISKHGDRVVKEHMCIPETSFAGIRKEEEHE